MTCSHCQTWNFRSYRYCRHCGTRLDQPAAVSPDGEPEDAEVEQILEQAFAHLDQGATEEAVAAAYAALSLQPGSAAAHSVLGGIYERQGLEREAIQQYELALQVNPGSIADREKLEALLARLSPPPRRARVTPVQVAVACAALAGVAVFATGVALLLNALPEAPGAPLGAGSRVARNSGATLAPAAAVNTPPPAALVGPPAPAGVAVPAPAAVAAPLPQPTPRNSPSFPAPLPRADVPTLAGEPAGIDAAAVGEVVPVPPAGPAAAPPTPAAGASGPAAAAAGTAAAPAPVIRPVLGGSPPPAPQAAPGTVSSPESGTTELSQPEDGFIRIEPLGGPAPAPGRGPAAAPRTEVPPAGKTPAAPPSIQVRIGPGGK